ncbi:hypothetical protein STENM223S_10557 [Streptomyces tendae]
MPRLHLPFGGKHAKDVPADGSAGRRSQEDDGPEDYGPDAATEDAAPDSPTELPKRSWSALVRRVVAEFQDDELTDRAAALTYYGILALFPALLVLVSLLGIAGESATQEVLDNVKKLAPGSARDVLTNAVEQLQAKAGLGSVLAVVGLVGAVWSASGYVGAFIRAANAVYDVDLEVAAPLVVADLQRGSGAEDAEVVHEDVHVGQRRQCLLGALLGAEVGRDRHERAAGYVGPQPADALLQPAGVAPVDAHGGPGPGQPGGDRRPDALRGARHQCGASAEVQVHRLAPCRAVRSVGLLLPTLAHGAPVTRAPAPHAAARHARSADPRCSRADLRRQYLPTSVPLLPDGLMPTSPTARPTHPPTLWAARGRHVGSAAEDTVRKRLHRLKDDHVLDDFLEPPDDPAPAAAAGTAADRIFEARWKVPGEAGDVTVRARLVLEPASAGGQEWSCSRRLAEARPATPPTSPTRRRPPGSRSRWTGTRSGSG